MLTIRGPIRFTIDMDSRSRGRVTDESLVKCVAAGDPEALAELFARHRDFVFRIAYGSCGDREEAVDVVQEVFVALLRQARTLQPSRGLLTTWLYRVTANKVADRRRRRTTQAAASLADVAEPIVSSVQDAVLLSKERRGMLIRALSGLPPRPREVFLLRVGLGLSVERTAEYLGTGQGVVRTALHTAKKLLQKTLDRAQKRGGSHARHLASG